MKKVSIKKLKPWEDNPRDLTESDYNRLIGQLRLGEIENIIVMKDGTVLNGNMRLRAYADVGIDEATIAEVEFKPADGGGFNLFVDGEQSKRYDEGHKGEATKFDSVEQGMLSIALAGNTHVGVFNSNLLEQLSRVDIPEDMFQVHMTPGTRVEDLIRAIGPTLPEADFDQDQMEEKLEVYEHGTIKQIVIYFTNDQYLAMMPRLDALMEDTGAKNNTDLFNRAIDALEEKVGAKTPEEPF